MRADTADPIPEPKTSSIRAEQAQVVIDRIIAATLGQIEDGIEPSMRAVAVRAAIAERTIYRYFPSLEELQTAVIPHLRLRVGYPLCNTAAELQAYVKHLYHSFRTSRELTRVLATASWAAPILRRTRSENKDQLLALLQVAYPDAPRAEVQSAAAVLRVPLSAAGWMYLEDCGYDQRTSIKHVQWLVKMLLGHLQKLQENHRA